MTTFEILQVVIGAGMLVVTGIALVVAIGQLRAASGQLQAIATASQLSARANQNSNILAVIALESSIADARYHYTESVARLASLPTPPDPKALEFATAIYEAAGEQYLNAADRLCACIIRGQVDEVVYRRDYRPWIAEIVKGFAKEFGAGTRHQNILTVHRAWSDDKSAIDPTIQTPS